MNFILATVTILEKIMDDSKPLNEATKDYFFAHYLPREDRKNIYAFVVKTLQNQRVIEKITEDSFPNVSPHVKKILCVSLTISIFFSTYAKEEIFEQAQSLLLTENISMQLLEKFIFKNYNSSKLVPSYVNVESLEYLQLRYNVPLWFIHMWNNHYGRALTPKLLAAVRKKHFPCFRVVRAKQSRKNFLHQHKDEYICGMSETTVLYQGKRPIRKLEAVRSGELIPIAEGTNHVINKIPLHGHDEILVVACEHSYFPFALYERGLGKQEILYALPTYKDVVEARKCKDIYQAEKMEIMEAPLSLLLTYVSHEKDLVVVLPPSSEFQKINATPDFFCQFRKEQLDGILEKQSLYLEESAHYVAPGGLLVYVIETANNKEGTLQIRNFLAEHKEFSLLEERQTLSIDKRHTSCYFAFLKKGGKKHD